MWEMAMIRNASAFGDGDQLSLLSYIFVDHPYIVCPIHPNFAHVTTSLWVCVENFCTLNVINSKSSPYFNLYHTHTHTSTIFFSLDRRWKRLFCENLKFVISNYYGKKSLIMSWQKFNNFKRNIIGYLLWIFKNIG